jgi:hypothetical protein
LAPALKEGAVTPLRGYRRFGLRNLLVGGQVAASLTILLLTSYLVVGYEKTTHIDPGFNTAGLYLFQLDPVRDGYPVERTGELFEKLPDRLSRIGAVTIAESTPLADLVAYPDVRVSASQHGGEQVLASVVRQRIGAHYFSTLGVPMIRGQEFDDRDVRENVAVAPAIVNQTAARELFGEANPVGSRIQEDGRSYAVIGVVRDTKSAVLMAKPASTMFLRLIPAQGANVIVRGTSGSDVMVGVREELAAVDSRLTIFNARSLHESVEQLNGLVRLSSLFYMGLGVFGLILASMGLAGVTAYAVVRRRKEIGIRMALGARSAQVLRLVLKEGASLVGAGSVLGFAGAYGANRVLTATADVLAKAFGSSAGNPVLLIGVPLLLAALAMAACYVPARRSTRIDPMVALREE